MAEVINPHDTAIQLPTQGITVEPGETVDVPAAVAKNLVAQGWTGAKKTKKEPVDDEKET